MKQDYEAGFRVGMELAEEERRTAEKKNNITEQLSACEDRVERAGHNMRNLSGLVALAIDSQLLDEDERNAFAYIYQALQETVEALDETVAMLLKTRSEVAS